MLVYQRVIGNIKFNYINFLFHGPLAEFTFLSWKKIYLNMFFNATDYWGDLSKPSTALKIGWKCLNFQQGSLQPPSVGHPNGPTFLPFAVHALFATFAVSCSIGNLRWTLHQFLPLQNPGRTSSPSGTFCRTKSCWWLVRNPAETHQLRLVVTFFPLFRRL